MKNLLLPALLLTTAPAALAQTAIPAGTVSLGGNIGYNRYSDTNEYKVGNNTITQETTQSDFRISPSIGYFIADNLAVGLNQGYSARQTKINNTGVGQTSPKSLDAATTFNVGPYVQYYQMLSDQFGVVGTLGAGYTSTTTPRNAGPSTVVEEKSSGFYTNLTPGIVFFPIPKFGISASVGGLYYNRVSLEQTNDPADYSRTNSDLGVSFGLDQLNFGGTYYFGR